MTNADRDVIDSLASRLTIDDDTPMPLAERDLLLDALRRMAEDELTLARQRRLLRLHEESEARIDALVRDGLNALRRRLDEPGVTTAHVEAAQRAREDLVKKLEEARSGRAVIAAALAFARDAAALAR